MIEIVMKKEGISGRILAQRYRTDSSGCVEIKQQTG